ncbi:MAG: 4Fe-4S dicluster domain-containing protein [Deltaproteobacteria bacterium]|nr:4Fe-4S dicluster domain-containing protein [Deltaproteobacteria bacterium]
MNTFRHLDNVVTLDFDPSLCVGCGLCTQVCPRGVFRKAEAKAEILDRNACMECGACALNCPTRAVTVTPGTGCAALIIRQWLPWTRSTSCC